MKHTSVILGDWGSTRLRLWRVEDGLVGPCHFAPGLFSAGVTPKEALANALTGLDGVDGNEPVLLCGMAGARTGLIEAPYAPCPTGVENWAKAAVSLELDGHRVTVLPGFSNRSVNGAGDVMRGEETQIFGALASTEETGGSRLVILPGTHSKWVWVEDGRIERFSTCITGELYARLLGSSLAPEGPVTDKEENDAGFAHGLTRSETGFLPALFEARASQMLDGKGADWSKGYLSGLLIGGEIAALRGTISPATHITLIGDPSLMTIYRRALRHYGLDGVEADGSACVLKGLEMAHATLG